MDLIFWIGNIGAVSRKHTRRSFRGRRPTRSSPAIQLNPFRIPSFSSLPAENLSGKQERKALLRDETRTSHVHFEPSLKVVAIAVHQTRFIRTEVLVQPGLLVLVALASMSQTDYSRCSVVFEQQQGSDD